MVTNLLSLSQRARMYRIETVVAPLLPREVEAVIAAFADAWTKPEEIERVARDRDGKGVGKDSTFALHLTAERDLRLGETADEVARLISYTIWKKLDRYVKITVDATFLNANPDVSLEFAEQAYAHAFGARFEN
jgi:uncharacterized protein YbcC (UPF0753/DUF2309 family)